MSREIRRVPSEWSHPTEPNPHAEFQDSMRRRLGGPVSRLLPPGMVLRFVPLFKDYPEAVARWAREGEELDHRTGFSWDWHLAWHVDGLTTCTCHPGPERIAHPFWRTSAASGEDEAVHVVDADELHSHLKSAWASERPKAADYMPEWSEEEADGWCLYETVTEGCPVTPVFPSAEELITHLAEIGEDASQEPYRREAAEALVAGGGSIGSFVITSGGEFLNSARDADRVGDEL